jgi:hypothetical protein
MAVMDGDEILKKIVIGIVLLFALKSFLSSGMFESPLYKAQGFSVMCPEGFKQAKTPAPMGIFANTSYEADSVTFIDPQEKYDLTVEPTSVSIFGSKLTAPMWIEDMFPDIITAIQQGGLQILDRGELMVDGQISKWVLTRQSDPPRMFLEFFMTDEKNGFFKIRYSADPNKFNRYRPAFESIRESFKFSTSLF